MFMSSNSSVASAQNFVQLPMFKSKNALDESSTGAHVQCKSLVYWYSVI